MSRTMPVTLIVAATPEMGIGHAGTLPWPQLKAEMAYFARVTRRAPAPKVNAVIMGRRTWESIPARFRPLRGRLNVVISRNASKLGFETAPRAQSGQREPTGTSEEDLKKPVAAGSIAEALAKLRTYSQNTNPAGSSGSEEAGRIHRVFVIGGAEIYAAALETSTPERILLTRIKNDFPCDTEFPLKLGEEPGQGWTERSKTELDEWVGEAVPAGDQVQDEIHWEYEMWEREAEPERQRDQR